jgi:hypothetical protein
MLGCDGKGWPDVSQSISDITPSKYSPRMELLLAILTSELVAAQKIRNISISRRFKAQRRQGA